MYRHGEELAHRIVAVGFVVGKLRDRRTGGRFRFGAVVETPA
jgi:hypothetical protein